MTADSLIGQIVAERYRVDALLGAGGMGAVYRARQLQLDHDVAIKLLSADRVGDADALERFRREAKHASKLDHPNLVPVTDFGQLEDGRPYLVMPLIEGRELGKGKAARLEPEMAVDIAAQVLDGLGFAHALGLVHRDLKPENVLIQPMPDGTQRVRLLDFGIALHASTAEGDGRLTRGNLVFGTPAYMSPEQAGGGAVDGRSDQYALGVMLYEMLAGRLPFSSSSPADVLRMHLVEPPPPLPEELPGALRAVVDKMLGKSRRERFVDAATAAEALRASLEASDSASAATVETSNSGVSTMAASRVSASTSTSTTAPVSARAAASRPDAKPGSAARWALLAALGLGGLGLVWAFSGPEAETAADTGTPLPDLEDGDDLPEPPAVDASGKKKPPRKKRSTTKPDAVEAVPDDGRQLPTLDEVAPPPEAEVDAQPDEEGAQSVEAGTPAGDDDGDEAAAAAEAQPADAVAEPNDDAAAPPGPDLEAEAG